MYKPELLKDFQITIQCLKKELTGSDAEKVNAAQEAYHKLLEDFYEEYEDMMAQSNTDLQRMIRTIFSY